MLLPTLTLRCKLKETRASARIRKSLLTGSSKGGHRCMAGLSWDGSHAMSPPLWASGTGCLRKWSHYPGLVTSPGWKVGREMRRRGWAGSEEAHCLIQESWAALSCVTLKVPSRMWCHSVAVITSALHVGPGFTLQWSHGPWSKVMPP